TLDSIICLPEQKSAVKEYPVMDLEEVKNLTVDSEIDDVVIAVPSARFAEIPGLMKALEHLCVPVRAILDLGEGVVVRELLFDFGGLRMLDLRATPSVSEIYLVAKRALHLLVSPLVLVATPPFTPLHD